MSAKIILINLVVVSLFGLSVGQAWRSPFFRYVGAVGELLEKILENFCCFNGNFQIFV
jgi:hypothetical protein